RVAEPADVGVTGASRRIRGTAETRDEERLRGSVVGRPASDADLDVPLRGQRVDVVGDLCIGPVPEAPQNRRDGPAGVNAEGEVARNPARARLPLRPRGGDELAGARKIGGVPRAARVGLHREGAVPLVPFEAGGQDLAGDLAAGAAGKRLQTLPIEREAHGL